jgi:Rps23 Pro-64 3,4-dihydroxylase Tpa1-like proline 4-hydroxylase
MKIGNGYIIGNGAQFFGDRYEELLNNVYNELSDIKDSFLIVTSENKVDNVKLIDSNTFAEQNIKKEEILKNPSIVQIWFQSVPNPVTPSTPTLEMYCYDKLKEFYSKNYKFGNPVFNMSIYNKGCFIKNHIDGYSGNDNRLCVVILYLNKDWKKGMGGELIVKTEMGDSIEIEPVFGNFTILDFTTANLEHEVKPVLSETPNRRALISFMTKNNK